MTFNTLLRYRTTLFAWS